MIGVKMLGLWLFCFFAGMILTGNAGMPMTAACGLSGIFPSVVLLVWILVRSGELPLRNDAQDAAEE